MTEIYKALGDDSRLRIMNLLMQRELCVCEIEAVLSMSQTNVSRHLNKLKAAGLTVAVKKAQWVYYSLSPDFPEQYPHLYLHLKAQSQAEPLLVQDLESLGKAGSQAELCAPTPHPIKI